MFEIFATLLLQDVERALQQRADAYMDGLRSVSSSNQHPQHPRRFGGQEYPMLASIAAISNRDKEGELDRVKALALKMHFADRQTADAIAQHLWLRGDVVEE
jgi:hypothetical protein